MGGYYLENLYKADPDHPVRQALSTRHNFRVIMEKLNATIAVVNNLVIRNNIVYTYIESVDATNPFEIDFHIPTATDAIKKISLTLKGVPFRAYSKAGAAAGTPNGGGDTSGAGGATTPTSSSGGGETPTSSGGGVVTSTSSGGHTFSAHRHAVVTDSTVSGNAVYFNGTDLCVTGGGSFLTAFFTIATIPAHTHTGGTHTHTVTTSNHTHTVTIANHTHTTPDHTHPNHTHTAVYGIYGSTTPTAVNGYYDDGGGYSGADSYGNAPDTTTPWNIKTEYDITDKYSGTGWKRLKLDTSRLGRFNIILMIEVDLTPTA